MKEFIKLYKEYDKSYYPIYKNFPSVWHFNHFLESDYRLYDQDIFIKVLNYYNAHFVYNDLNNKIIYIGFANWLIDEDIDGPSWEEFPHYVNETNSCKISHDNFKEFIEKWVQLKKELPPFALIYRDNFDWIDCKGFDTQEAMELFIKNYKDEVVH